MMDYSIKLEADHHRNTYINVFLIRSVAATLIQIKLHLIHKCVV